jgi:hypothetical protein
MTAQNKIKANAKFHALIAAACLGLTGWFLSLQRTSDLQERKSKENSLKSSRSVESSTSNHKVKRFPAVPRNRQGSQAPPESVINLERTDTEYERRIERHRAILQHLKSPRRNNPEYQRVLELLLENGYDIRHWPASISAITTPSMIDATERKTCRVLGLS